MFEIHPIVGIFGAEIAGIDLASRLDDDEVISKLVDAFHEYKVLVIRDQHLMTPAQQVALGRHFGELEIHPFHPNLPEHPEVIVLRSDGQNRRHKWHSDVTFSDTPPLGSILRAIDIPPYGRDTVFADVEAVYAGLSSRLQRMLEGLTALHDWRHVFKSVDMVSGELPPAEHPVIRVHPVTGRRCLFVNPLFTTRIVGMHENESDALLRTLYSEIHRSEYQLRCRWHPGTLALWDNRCVQHALVEDLVYPRVMHRVTIAGNRPHGPS